MGTFVCLFADCQEDTTIVRAESARKAATLYANRWYKRRFGHTLKIGERELVAVTTRTRLRNVKDKYPVALYRVTNTLSESKRVKVLPRLEPKPYTLFTLFTELLLSEWGT